MCANAEIGSEAVGLNDVCPTAVVISLGIIVAVLVHMSGILPRDWKRCLVNILPKIQNQHNLVNTYILLFSYFERIQFNDFFNAFLNHNQMQSVYRKSLSVATVIVNQKLTVLVLLDFGYAFDAWILTY